MLTTADRRVIAAIVDAAVIRGEAIPDEAVGALWRAFKDRDEATVREVGTTTERLWHVRKDRARRLTEAELDEVLRLKAKGWASWDEADRESYCELTLTPDLLTRPWVEQHLMGSPVEAHQT